MHFVYFVHPSLLVIHGCTAAVPTTHLAVAIVFLGALVWPVVFHFLPNLYIHTSTAAPCPFLWLTATCCCTYRKEDRRLHRERQSLIRRSYCPTRCLHIFSGIGKTYAIRCGHSRAGAQSSISFSVRRAAIVRRAGAGALGASRMQIGMERRRRIRGTTAQACRCYQRPALSVLVLGWAVCLRSLASAQNCNTPPITTPIRVENATGVASLQAEANCSDRGSVQAVWAGAAVAIDTPIAIASGTSLTVTGDDALAGVQGGSKTRLFEVSPGGSLTLKQLKLSGGAAENGGAIYSDRANLTLEGCVFEDNAATDGDGGAVWADGGDVRIVGGEFFGNHATRSGGAVLATNSILVVKEGARFENNKAAEGGALYCGVMEFGLGTGSGPSCSISNAEFVSNNASLEMFLDFTDVVRWEDLDGGGAAAFWFTEADITDSVFTSNYAQFTGGAVFGGNDTDIIVQGCNFSSNTAKGYGGAIGASSMTLGADTQLLDNKAILYNGGAVSWY